MVRCPETRAALGEALDLELESKLAGIDHLLAVVICSFARYSR